MNNYYVLTDEAYKKHRNRIFQLLGAFAATAVVTLILGLVRWSEAAYTGVNILLLAVVAVGIIAQTRFGGFLDGKPEALKKTVTTGTVIGTAVLWLLMTITGLHYALSIVIWIVAIVLVVKLADALKDIVVNCWNALATPDPKNYTEMLDFQVVLEGVHTGASLTSPIGKVFIGRNTVLFVLCNHMNGFVRINSDGSVEVRKRKLFSRKDEKAYIDKNSILRQAEQGAEHIRKILEEGCQKRGVAMPNMAYTNAMFLPNFQRETDIYHEDYTYYYNIPWYASHGQSGAHYDFFRGKACYNYADIGAMLRCYDEQFHQAYPDAVRTTEEMDMIAQIIAEACELRPSTAYQDCREQAKTAARQAIDEQIAKYRSGR